MRLSLRALSPLLALGSTLIQPAEAQIQIAPGIPLRAIPFPAPVNGFAVFPNSGDTAFPAFFYMAAVGAPGQYEIQAVDTEGNVSPFTSIPGDGLFLHFPRDVARGRLFATEYGIPSRTRDGVYEIASDGSRSTFSYLAGSNPNPWDVVGAGGAFGDVLLVACLDGDSGTSFDDSVYRFRPDGTPLGPLHRDGRAPWNLAVSTGGSYGAYVYCVYYYDSVIDRIDPNGNVTRNFADLGTTGGWIDFGRGGTMGTSLYGANRRGELFRIDPAGNITLVATGLDPSGVFDVDPSSGDLFTTSGNSFYRVTSAVTATCSSRNGSGSNPAVCTCGTLPVLGTAWEIDISATQDTLQTFALLSTLASVPIALPVGELLTSPPHLEIPGNGTHSVPVPTDAGLQGIELFVQGARMRSSNGRLRLELTNAQDCVLGF